MGLDQVGGDNFYLRPFQNVFLKIYRRADITKGISCNPDTLSIKRNLFRLWLNVIILIKLHFLKSVTIKQLRLVQLFIIVTSAYNVVTQIWWD